MKLRLAVVGCVLMMMASMWMLLITREYVDRNKYFLMLVAGFVGMIFFLYREKNKS